MSFTADIKRELIKSYPQKRCCMLSLLAFFILTGGERTEGGFSFTGENEAVASYILRVTELLFGRQMTLTEAVRDPKHGRDKLTFAMTGAERMTGELFSHEPQEECCARAALCGAFLGGGSCTLPRGNASKGYHLEIVFPTAESAEAFLSLLDRLQLFGGIVRRGERFVVYCKSREGIGDFLSVLGAASALKTLEQISALREENNQRNRLENCMAGNIDRSMTASAEQVRLFTDRRERLEALPSPLRETALARIQSPTLSLQELAARLSLSKGGLSHRLRRITELLSEEKNDVPE